MKALLLLVCMFSMALTAGCEKNSEEQRRERAESEIGVMKRKAAEVDSIIRELDSQYGVVVRTITGTRFTRGLDASERSDVHTKLTKIMSLINDIFSIEASNSDTFFTDFSAKITITKIRNSAQAGIRKIDNGQV